MHHQSLPMMHLRGLTCSGLCRVPHHRLRTGLHHCQTLDERDAGRLRYMWFPFLPHSLPSNCTLYKSNLWCDTMAMISLDISAELWRRSPRSQLHYSPHRWRNRGLQRKRPCDSARHDSMHRLHTGAVPTTGQLYLSYLSLILRNNKYTNFHSSFSGWMMWQKC